MKKIVTEVIFETSSNEDITLSYLNGQVSMTAKACFVTPTEMAILQQAVQELMAQAQAQANTQQDHCLG